MSQQVSAYCPYCGKAAELVDISAVYRQSYGMIWLCKPCDAYVGVHKNSPKFAPLGTLATKELRKLRNQVHSLFDPRWRKGKMTRSSAYAWLANQMNLRVEKTHVALFDEHQCKLALEILKPKF